MTVPARISIVTLGVRDVARSVAFFVKPGTELPFGYGCYFADPDDHVWEVCYNASFPIGPDGRISID